MRERLYKNIDIKNIREHSLEKQYESGCSTFKGIISCLCSNEIIQ